MRAAPAVEVALSPGRAERLALAGLYGLAGGVTVAWVLLRFEAAQSLPVWVAASAVAVLAAAAGLLLARRVLPPTAGHLGWDGQGWHWRQASGTSLPLASVQVTLDLGSWLLLRLHPRSGRAAWRAARASAAGGGWHALRVALAAHAGRPIALDAHAG